jgi:S1-C subfamily serine protease
MNRQLSNTHDRAPYGADCGALLRRGSTRTPYRSGLSAIVFAAALMFVGGQPSATAVVAPAGQSRQVLQQDLPPARDPDAAVGPVITGIVDIDASLDLQHADARGTGIVLNSTGEVLTNNHVVAGGSAIVATDLGNKQHYTVDVIGYDRGHDIALLQLRGASDLATAPLGDSSTVAVGDPVVGIGNAAGTGSPPSIEPGSVSALDTSVSAVDELSGVARQLTGLIQSSSKLRPGDSGGPLVNAAGQVVGIDAAATPGYKVGGGGGGGFSIPIDQALDIAAQIRNGAASASVHIGDTAFLGVAPDDGKGKTDASVTGALVTGLVVDGPAARAGLGLGDLITGVDGVPINSAAALTDLLDQHHPGDSVTLNWFDASGVPHSAQVILASGPVG